MNEPIDEQPLAEIFALAFKCVAPGTVDRPDMKTVGEQLWAIRMEHHMARQR